MYIKACDRLAFEFNKMECLTTGLKRIIGLCLLIAILGGCKKWIIDYRNKWSGKYKMHLIKKSWIGSSWRETEMDIDGTLYYRPLRNMGRTMKMEWSFGYTHSFRVNRGGEISNDSNPEIGGQITGTSISYTMQTEGNPGDTFTVTGTRYE